MHQTNFETDKAWPLNFLFRRNLIYNPCDGH